MMLLGFEWTLTSSALATAAAALPPASLSAMRDIMAALPLPLLLLKAELLSESLLLLEAEGEELACHTCSSVGT